MNKTETSAKILKGKNQTKHETNPWGASSSREQHRILAAILNFNEEAEKCKKKITEQIS